MYEIIQNLCKTNGITITALCEKITGSKGNLSTWKKNNIRNDYLLKISEYFNVSTDYLLGNGQKEKSLSTKDKLINEIVSELYNKSDDELIAFKDMLIAFAKSKGK